MAANKRKQGRQQQGQKAIVPASQRTTGHLIWSLLLGVFGLLIAFSAAGGNWVALILGAATGAGVGYALGRKMERESKA
jgi:hypothetical protein